MGDAVGVLEGRLAVSPFRAPKADELAWLGLGARELAAAVRAGRLSKIAEGLVLGPDVWINAEDVLAALPQPFTVSEARKALDTTPRVAVPLLEQLDATGVTVRLDNGTRTVAVRSSRAEARR